jgi:hypothetical protein
MYADAVLRPKTVSTTGRSSARRIGASRARLERAYSAWGCRHPPARRASCQLLVSAMGSSAAGGPYGVPEYCRWTRSFAARAWPIARPRVRRQEASQRPNQAPITTGWTAGGGEIFTRLGVDRQGRNGRKFCEIIIPGQFSATSGRETLPLNPAASWNSFPKTPPAPGSFPHDGR